MNKTIIFSFFLAATALLCSATSVFFEIAAESNRLQVEAYRIAILQQDPFRRAKLSLLFEKELEFSQLQSSVPFRVRPEDIDYFKKQLFLGGTTLARFESGHIKKLDWANSFDLELKNEATVLSDDIESFLLILDSEQLGSINLEEYKKKFNELQSLISRLNTLGKKGVENKEIKSQQLIEQAKALSAASTYLIFAAFLMEIIIFVLIQFLEVRSKRRLSEKGS